MLSVVEAFEGVLAVGSVGEVLLLVVVGDGFLDDLDQVLLEGVVEAVLGAEVVGYLLRVRFRLDRDLEVLVVTKSKIQHKQLFLLLVLPLQKAGTLCHLPSCYILR